VPFISAVLGDAVECWRGVVDNRPGSATQGWHRDGQPLYDHVHLPAHCVVLFVPLVDVDCEALGPTQFYPGSHATFRSHQYAGLPEGKCSKPACMPMLAKGSVLAFDFRTLHRGTANTTTDTRRPVFYVIYAKRWFHIEEDEGAFPTDQPLFLPTGDSTSAGR
jgi:ectoine hydroxylase-related dioxygenase (phytanoyl-CoA dioxygenase family)